MHCDRLANSFSINMTKIFYQVSSGEILLKELKTEADKMKTLNAVQSTVMSFFKIDNWDEAITRFGASVGNEKLLRFTVRQQINQSKFLFLPLPDHIELTKLFCRVLLFCCVII